MELDTSHRHVLQPYLSLGKKLLIDARKANEGYLAQQRLVLQSAPAGIVSLALSSYTITQCCCMRMNPSMVRRLLEIQKMFCCKELLQQRGA